MITLDNVGYTYPGTLKPALRNVTLHIPEGQFCAVIGANGAGKSTLAYAIAGYVPHFYHGALHGDVIVAGKKTHTVPLSELVLSVGLVFQNPYNQISGTKFTVLEEVAFGLENLGLPRGEMLTRVEETLNLMGISELADRYPLSISGGEMQRVAIASVLAMKPKVLVLDEPTSQLDPIGSRMVFSALQNLKSGENITIVMIEHKLEWIGSFADRVIAMVNGKIMIDRLPREVLTDGSLLSHGIGQTRYTMAARQVHWFNRWPSRQKFPVTLPEAVETFKDVKQIEG